MIRPLNFLSFFCLVFIITSTFSLDDVAETDVVSPTTPAKITRRDKKKDDIFSCLAPPSINIPIDRTQSTTYY